MDNQATISILLVIIVVLFYVYRIKRRRLAEEEQKYIQKFLINNNVQLLRSSSPHKARILSPNRSAGRLGLDLQASATRSSQRKASAHKRDGSHSPTRRSVKSTSTTPKAVRASPIKRFGSQIIKSFNLSAEKPMDNNTLKHNEISKTSQENSVDVQKVFSVLDDKKVFGQTSKNLRGSSSPNLLGKKSVTIKEHESEHLDSPGILGKSQKLDSANKNLERDTVTKKNSDRPIGAKTLIKFTESDEDSDIDPQADQPKKQDKTKPALSKKQKESNFYYQNISDSSVQSEPSDEDESAIENLPLGRKQFLDKNPIDTTYFTEYGHGNSLKKYVAKKMVQEQTREMLFGPQVHRKPLLIRSNIGATTAQSTQPSTNTGLLGQNQASKTTASSISQPTSQTSAQSKPSGLFAGASSASSAVASGGSAQTKPSGLLAGNASLSAVNTTASNTTPTQTQAKPSGLFASSNTATSTTYKPSGLLAGSSNAPADTTSIATANSAQAKPSGLFAGVTSIATTDNTDIKQTRSSGLLAGNAQEKPNNTTGTAAQTPLFASASSANQSTDASKLNGSQVKSGSGTQGSSDLLNLSPHTGKSVTASNTNAEGTSQQQKTTGGPLLFQSTNSTLNKPSGSLQPNPTTVAKPQIQTGGGLLHSSGSNKGGSSVTSGGLFAQRSSVNDSGQKTPLFPTKGRKADDGPVHDIEDLSDHKVQKKSFASSK